MVHSFGGGHRRYPNALVLATSNLCGAIDAAFIDRADIKQFIPHPSAAARYDILRRRPPFPHAHTPATPDRTPHRPLGRGCIAELVRRQLIAPSEPLLSYAALLPLIPSPPPDFDVLASLQVDDEQSAAPRHSMLLYLVVILTDGLSGRALRKLPFLAHALFAPSSTAATGTGLGEFIGALHAAARHELSARAEMAAESQPSQ